MAGCQTATVTTAAGWLEASSAGTVEATQGSQHQRRLQLSTAAGRAGSHPSAPHCALPALTAYSLPALRSSQRSCPAAAAYDPQLPHASDCIGSHHLRVHHCRQLAPARITPIVQLLESQPPTPPTIHQVWRANTHNQAGQGSRSGAGCLDRPGVPPNGPDIGSYGVRAESHHNMRTIYL